MPILSLVLPLLAGCFSEQDYAEGYWEANCERVLECYSEESLALLEYSDVEGCLEYNATNIEVTASTAEAEDCAFDRKAASDCIDGLYEISCDDYLAASFPDACAEICAQE